MKKETGDLIQLHFIVFIYGFTAILGRLINLDAIQLVWYRMIIAFISLGAMLLIFKMPIKVSKKDLLKLIGVGFIVAMHWLPFFMPLKYPPSPLLWAVLLLPPCSPAYWSRSF